ncbi:MAG: DMT family transporter [Leptotrichiaceae bacterium]|nr:DMT family transporter [Leptotrichiaceae bacterium]
MKRHNADMGLLLVGILWGLGFVFVKIGLNEGIDPFYLLTIRFLGGFTILFAIFGKKMRKITLYDLKAGIIIGMFQFFGYTLQTYGMTMTTASNNAFFTAINVVIVPYFFWFIYKERPDKTTFIASILCVLGVGIMSFDNNMNLTNLNKGDALTIICAVFFAAQVAATGYYSERIHTLNLVFIQMIVGGVLFLLNLLFISGAKEIKLLHGMSLIAILYLTIFSTAIPFLLQTYFQKWTTSTRASIIMTTESLFAPLFAFFLLGEVLTLKVITGAGLIMLSVFVSEIKFKKKELEKG